jgi:AbiV family abortive infection protein
MSSTEIPVTQLDTGLKICAANIRQFVKDVDILLENSSIFHATTLAIFAVEELAKYSELERVKRLANGPTVQVDDRLFRSHPYKQGLAKKLISNEAWILAPAVFEPAYFDSKYFDSRYFATGSSKPEVTVSPTLRLDCSFVNWKDGGWVYGSGIQMDRLKQFAENILDVLAEFESSPPKVTSEESPN